MRRFCLWIASALVGFAHAAEACTTALVLTIDVSNSVDAAEYRLQIDGLADALQDPEIVQAMVSGDVALAVVQWSGEDDQALSIPWRQIRTTFDAQSLATEVRALPRAFILSGTAPADAIYFSLDLFDSAPDCRKQVIDVSGDGTPNAGRSTSAAAKAAQRQGVTINGIAIEGMGLAITTFYHRQLITRDGFVITARRHIDYPNAIRRKLIRELTTPIG